MKQKFSMALSLAVILSMLLTSLALADNLKDNATSSGNNVITAGGSTTIKYWIQSQGACEAADSSPSVVTINVPAGVTVDTDLVTSGDQNTLTFTACNTSNEGHPNNTQDALFSSSNPESYLITHSVSDPSGAANVSSANFTLTVNSAPVSDGTPPDITPSIFGTLGNNGWYTSDVTVSWSVVDNESAISSSNGCDETTISDDTDGTELTCTATSTGGTSSQSVTIKRDATAPSISGLASPAANGAGWNKADVAVSFTCNDNLSGVASCGPNSTLASEGAGQSAAGTAVDNAGNSASTTVSDINIDKTAPTISGAPDRAANGAGWYNADVTVNFTCDDVLSGVASCPSPSTLGEGADQSVTGTAADNAGNSASTTVSGINIDKTAPTITFVSPSTSPWYNADVTANWSCSDALSGEVSTSANATTNGEGAAVPATGTCADQAGNSASDMQSFKVDKTAPTVTVTGVTDGATYTLGSVPVAGCSTSDALSGVATNASLNLSGGLVGDITATCSGASDNAGNTAGTASATYHVNYNWNGFFQPIDNLPTLNRVKAGSAIPVKFSLNGNQGLNIFAAGYPVSTVTTCGTTATDEVESTVTAGSSSLSYDALANQYIYVWKTDKSWTGCRTLTVKLADGTIHQANFTFTK